MIKAIKVEVIQGRYGKIQMYIAMFDVIMILFACMCYD